MGLVLGDSGLFLGGGNAGGAAVVGENDGMAAAVVVVEGNLELVGERVDDGSADAEAGEGAWAGEVGNGGEVGPVAAEGLEVVVDEAQKVLGEGVAGFPGVGVVVKLEDAGRSGGI